MSRAAGIEEIDRSCRLTADHILPGSRDDSEKAGAGLGQGREASPYFLSDSTM